MLKSEVGQVFNIWSEIDYVGYKAMTKETDWCSLLRQKINNLYTRYFDKDVILKKDYMDLLRIPKKLYYRWICGEEFVVDELVDVIENSFDEAMKLKILYQKYKMDLSWEEYKNVVESLLKKIFDRCKLIEDYEVDNLTNTNINKENKYIYDFYNEDKSYIKYICDSLEGEMLKWQKKYYKVRDHKKYKRCKECGTLIEVVGRNTQYCSACKRKKELERHKKYNKKRKRQF